jgi:hypothetical protein
VHYSEILFSFLALYKRKITFRQNGVKLPPQNATQLTGLPIDVGALGLPDVST